MSKPVNTPKNVADAAAAKKTETPAPSEETTVTPDVKIPHQATDEIRDEEKAEKNADLLEKAKGLFNRNKKTILLFVSLAATAAGIKMLRAQAEKNEEADEETYTAELVDQDNTEA